MASVAGVPHAIKALYGHDAAQRQAANAWLTSFAASSQAWDCVQLLEPGIDAEVQFFSTNILLSKVRQGWHKLPPDMQPQISSYLRSVVALQHFAASCNTCAQTSCKLDCSGRLDTAISNPAASKPVLQRLCLLVASIAVHDGPSAGEQLLSYAVTKASGQNQVRSMT